MTRVDPIRVPRSLPRGVHGLDRDVVLMSQRARLLEAIVRAVAANGYSATRVQDITRLAGVSRTTFYEQFADKEECFLVAYEHGSHAHLEKVETAIRRTDGWVGKLREATRAYVEVLAAEPDYARTFLIEVHGAGPRARAARVEVHSRYSQLLRRWHHGAREELGGLPDVPAEIFMAAVAAADEIVAARIVEGEGERLLDVTPTLVYLHLALFGVADAARGELQR
jgi:AcrR family transcriptional regulator